MIQIPIVLDSSPIGQLFLKTYNSYKLHQVCTKKIYSNRYLVILYVSLELFRSHEMKYSTFQILLSLQNLQDVALICRFKIPIQSMYC